MVCLSGISCARAEGPKLRVFWETVSPNGKYALAWSATDNEWWEGSVSNYLIEIATSKAVLELSDLHHWLPDDHHDGNKGFTFETVWSDDSRQLLVLYQYDAHAEVFTDTALLIDVSVPQVANVTQQMKTAFSKRIAAEYGKKYTRMQDSILLSFGNPSFIGHDRFFVSADAGVRHNDDPDHAYGYDFYFQIRNAGRTVKLVKVDPENSEPVKFPKSWALEPWDEPDEPLDRGLNRIYRLLHGLLSDSDQKKLAEEERAWLLKRDAVTAETERNAIVKTRIDELKNRADTIIGEKREAQEED
jgi:hypothetical protein